MNELEKLNEYLNIKKEKINNELDKEKINVVESLLKDKAIFFKLKSSTAIGILKYLEIPENEINDFYLKLISAENYLKSRPKQRIIIEDINLDIKKN